MEAGVKESGTVNFDIPPRSLTVIEARSQEFLRAGEVSTN